MNGQRFHNMKAVELRTGLSAHLIRIWERRYAAVTPARSDSRQRVYSEEEVERLLLLGRLTQSGLTISRIARLPLDELRALLERADSQPPVPAPAPPSPRTAPAPFLLDRTMEEAMTAIRGYNLPALEKLLDRTLIALGYSGLLEKILIPLLQLMGDEWEAGNLTASQEHGASAALREYLCRNLNASHAPETAPRLLVTTPLGQCHEMGAYIAACLARKAGWNVTYLGSSLPADEIIGAALAQPTRAVALSIIYPADDPALPAQLLRLRQHLPPEIPILAGGRAVPAYRETLDQIGAHILTEMSGFTPLLAAIRESTKPLSLHHPEAIPATAPDARKV